jgi:tripartite-type tricarboxylate transporter receptor subunit TctC
MFAPRGTPKDVIDRHNGAALRDKGARKRLLELGLELPDEAAQTPTALGELVVRNEIDRWVPIIKKAGVVVQ